MTKIITVVNVEIKGLDKIISLMYIICIEREENNGNKSAGVYQG